MTKRRGNDGSNIPADNCTSDDRVSDYTIENSKGNDCPPTLIDDSILDETIYEKPNTNDVPQLQLTPIGQHLVGEMVRVLISPAILGMYGVERKIYRYLMQSDSGELYIRYYGQLARVAWRGDDEYEVVDKFELR